MIPPKCRRETQDPIIPVSEGRRKATFRNDNRELHHVVRFDGCVVDNKRGADFVVEKPSERGASLIVVELKGTDIDHAADQIVATATWWRDRGLAYAAIAGLIVCRQYPSEDTGLQRRRRQFAKQFRGRIVVRSGSVTTSVAELLVSDRP